MKKLISITPPIAEIHRDDLPEFPIIGFSMENQKGWIQCKSYQKKKYILYCVDDAQSGVGMGNGWRDGEEMSMETAINFLLNCNGTIYVFENDRKLFKWLSEK